MRTLFEISEDLHFLSDFLTEAGGDITEESLEAEIDKWLADLGAERDTKIDNYCALYKELEARATARKVEAARVADLANIDANAAARLKSRLHKFFIAHNIDKIETLRFKVGRAKNGGALPVIIDPSVAEAPELLPEHYLKVMYAPDFVAIKADLDAGAELLWAKLGERGEHLRIK